MPGERTEQATQHRREKARREGDILHSRELTAAAGTLAGAMALGVLGPRTMEAWRGAFAGFLALGTPAHWEPATLEPTLVAVRRLTLEVLAPPAVVMALVVVAALWERASPRPAASPCTRAPWHGSRSASIPSRISKTCSRCAPRPGSRNRSSRQRFSPCLPCSASRGSSTFHPFRLSGWRFSAKMFTDCSLAAAWLLFGWSAIDYLVEWQSRESRLKMSKQDMRDEYKETEGSPQIRGRIRNLQRQMRRRRVKADVVKGGRGPDQPYALRGGPGL